MKFFARHSHKEGSALQKQPFNVAYAAAEVENVCRPPPRRPVLSNSLPTRTASHAKPAISRPQC
jgi:hypothetical protein